jgi:TfoX/Sxy family transcriptional regulator of competence genes
MVSNEQLTGKIRALTKHRKLSEKKMFGGMTFLLNDNMCFGTLKDDLIIRVGPERYKEALALPHARPMDFTGRPTTGFVFVDSKGWSNDATLKKWLDMGIGYASSLPKKTTMQRKAAR